MLRLSRLNAYQVYLIMGGVSSVIFSMIFTVLGVYFVQTVGMNPLQLVLVGTVLEGTVLLFEVPTGIVADAYSRRLSVIIGYALIGVCYLLQGFLPIYLWILAAEIVRGVGETFTSGAREAWIADEVGEERVGRVYLRNGQVRQVGAFIGIALGTGLGAYQLQLPIYLGGALLLLLSGWLAFAMPETSFKPQAQAGGETPWQAMRRIGGEGYQVVRGRPVVLMLVLVGIVFGASSEGFDRLWEAHFLTTFPFPTSIGSMQLTLPPVVWIGLINGGGMLIGIFVAEVLVRRWETHGSRRLGPLLLINSVGLILAVIGFGLAPTFGAALLIFWVAGVLRSLQVPIAGTWLNQHVPSRVRATVLSMVGQADALGQVAGGPVVGLVGLRSLRAALVFAGLILIPAPILYGRGLHLEQGSGGAPEVIEVAEA